MTAASRYFLFPSGPEVDVGSTPRVDRFHPIPRGSVTFGEGPSVLAYLSICTLTLTCVRIVAVLQEIVIGLIVGSSICGFCRFLTTLGLHQALFFCDFSDLSLKVFRVQ